VIPFEFALVNDDYLANFAKYPDKRYFAEHLECISSGDNPAGCVFSNLGGDAILVAPRDWSPESSPTMYENVYGHLGNFVRGAPETQVAGLWEIVGVTLKEKLLPSTKATSAKPIWFSTAGTGE